jgi:hypothetical protein
VAYFSPTSGLNERVSRTLKGYPTPQGDRSPFPLADEDLEQFKRTETLRKRIRNAAALYQALSLLSFIGAVVIVAVALVGLTGGGSGGREAGIVTLVLAGLALGLGMLYLLCQRHTLRCRKWAPIMVLCLSMLVVAFNLFVLGMALFAAERDSLARIFGAVFGMLLPLAFAWVSARALMAIPKFLAQPVWCVEALVHAGL